MNDVRDIQDGHSILNGHTELTPNIIIQFMLDEKVTKHDVYELNFHEEIKGLNSAQEIEDLTYIVSAIWALKIRKEKIDKHSICEEFGCTADQMEKESRIFREFFC